jgi:serine/threonine protein phosphatase PrpC
LALAMPVSDVNLPGGETPLTQSRLRTELTVGVLTDVGRQRTQNEDTVYADAQLSSSGWLGVVADGIGGRLAGEIASALAVQTIRDTFREHADDDPSVRLHRAVEAANATVYELSRSSPDYAGMGSTVTAAAIVLQRLVVAQVGDSRAYVLRDARLLQLTHDHSVVEELIRAHKLTRDEARTHGRRNVITRNVGADPQVAVDMVEFQLRDGDRVLLCSDGLHASVEDSVIARALDAPPDVAAQTLVDLANEQGGRDNVSVVVVKVAVRPQVTKAQTLPVRQVLIAIGLALACLAAAACYYFFFYLTRIT